MKDPSTANPEFIEEISLLKQKINKQEQSEVEHFRVEEGLREQQTELVTQIDELRRSTVELEAMRAGYFDLYGLAPVGYCTVNEQGLILLFTPTAITILGGSRKDLIKQPITRFILEEDQAIYYRHRTELFETGEPQACELRMVKMDGTPFWAYLAATAAQDTSGAPLYRVVLADITERKRLEEKLQEERENFRFISENAPLGMAMIGKDGAFKYINPKFKELFGYDLEDISDGKTWFRKAYPDHEYRRKAISTWIDDVQNNITRKPSQWVFEVKCKDGSEKTISFLTMRLKEGKYVMTCEDITERKHAEKALKESEERYRIAIEAANDGVAIVQNDIHVYVNQTFLKIFGYSSLDEIVGKRRYCTVHPDDYERVLDYAAARQGNKYAPIRYEFKGIKKDKTPIDIEVSVNTISYKGEKAILAYLRDITDRKQAENQIRVSLKEKEILLKEIQHRVKNNLLTISGILALQLERIKDSESKDAFITSMNRINAMTKIHTRLYQSESFSLIHFKGYMEELLRELSRSYGFSFEDMITDISNISFDINTAIPVGLIVNELVSNAMKHAFPDGRKGQITITLSTENSHVILSVSDNGIGLPSHIDFKNTESIGLSLLKQLVEQINGTMELLGDKGARFIITFSVH